MSEISEDIIRNFESFLVNHGLTRRQLEEPRLVENVISYTCDYGLNWLVNITDLAVPNEHYDFALFYFLLFDEAPSQISFFEQIHFAEIHWPDIVRSFAEDKREATHANLAFFRQKRAERLFKLL